MARRAVQQVAFGEKIFPHAANFYKFLVFNQCARPFFVYVETFSYAFIKLFFTVAFLDLGDFLRMRGKNIASQGLAKRRGRGRKIRKPRYQQSPGNVKRYAAGGLRTLLVVTQPLEWIGLAWLLYAAGDQFYYDWQSYLENSEFCTQPGVPAIIQQSRIGGSVSILPGGAAISMPTVEQKTGALTSNAFGVGGSAGEFFSVVALTVTGPSGGISGVFLRLNIQSGATNLDAVGPPVDIAEGEQVDLIVSTNFSIPVGKVFTLTWVLVGPAVPVGLKSESGYAIVSKSG